MDQSRGIKKKIERKKRKGQRKMRLKRAKKEQLAQVKQLYKTAFPKEERRPFFLLQLEMKKRVMEILSVEEDGFAGLLISSFYKDLVLIEFLAIDDRRRGEGLGSKVLALAKKSKKKRILCKKWIFAIWSGSDVSWSAYDAINDEWRRDYVCRI